ncbi:Cellobiose 2-epimerase [termite gut metagenome]|uniref:Cellobiose 2-epimerase n=1 Tax=termite gut metagenome TaxID=433724 RepID=A0A5J4SD43_9ZZZZ
MKNTVILIAALFVMSCTGSTPEEKELSLLREEITQDLEGNILSFWKKHSPDPNGGFYGVLRFDATPEPEADKGGVLNARLVWTFSTAYRLLKDESYKQLADRAQAYFIEHFIDKEYGGTYWSLKADGSPSIENKQTYGNAFAIYGLSEHYRATGNEESLRAAISVYNSMIEHAYDPEHGGFIESFTRDWKMNETRMPKTMNNNLHVLEALTNLYRVWPDAGLQKHLREQIDIVSNKILDQTTWHERLYLTMDWQSTYPVDSYGHDIEFSWLLVEAAEALGDEAIIEETKRYAVHIAETQMKQGLNAMGAMMSDKSGEHLNTTLEWWQQSETIVGFLNAWQISGDKKFLDGAVRTWNWIKEYMIDYEYGEWYTYVKEDGTQVKDHVKADMWRCPYHNSRMGFEVMTRFR